MFEVKVKIEIDDKSLEVLAQIAKALSAVTPETVPSAPAAPVVKAAPVAKAAPTPAPASTPAPAPAAPVAAVEKTYTKEQMLAMLADAAKKRGPSYVKGLLTQMGVACFSEIVPDSYPAVVNYLNTNQEAV